MRRLTLLLFFISTYCISFSQTSQFNGICLPYADLYTAIPTSDVGFGDKLKDAYPNDFTNTENEVQPAKLIGGSYPMCHNNMQVFLSIDRRLKKFLNIYEATANVFGKENIKQYHNSLYPSSIVLPIMK